MSQIFLCQLLPLSQPLGKPFSPSQRTVAFPTCKLKIQVQKVLNIVLSGTKWFNNNNFKKTLKVNVYRKLWVSKMTCTVRSMQSGLNASGPCVSHLCVWLGICTSGFSYSVASGTSKLLRTGCSQLAISSTFAPEDTNHQVGQGGWCNVNSLWPKGERTCGLCLCKWNSEFVFLGFPWTKFYASKVNH